MMQKQLIPSAKSDYGGTSNIVFQQERCSLRAKSVRTFLEGEGLELLSRTAQNPEMNPCKKCSGNSEKETVSRIYVFYIYR